MSDEEQRELSDYEKRQLTPIDDIIAEAEFVMVVGTSKNTIKIQIGRPYWDDGMAFCPVAAWGMWGRNPDVAGATSLQSLALAIAELTFMLPKWASTTNARFFYPGHEEAEVVADQLLGAGLAYVGTASRRTAQD